MANEHARLQNPNEKADFIAMLQRKRARFAENVKTSQGQDREYWERMVRDTDAKIATAQGNQVEPADSTVVASKSRLARVAKESGAQPNGE